MPRKQGACYSSRLPLRQAGACRSFSQRSVSTCVIRQICGAFLNSNCVICATAKNLPIESMLPKAGAAGAAGGAAGNRRATAGQAGNAGPGNKVNLNDGAANKARGGCC
jgi:hypothetical protein